MIIRARRDADLPSLVAMADALRQTDQWPPHRVSSTEAFILGTEPLAALVAEVDNSPVGQVILHAQSADSVTALAAEALGLEREQLVVVARLFVGAGTRREGIGRRLLDAAANAARAEARHPVLDVWTELPHAIALYERAGWRRLGEVSFTFRAPCGSECFHAGSTLRSFVYSAPTE